MICKNCKHEFQGNYCNNCGQSAETHRIDIHFLWHDIQHSLFHLDSGIFYSFSQLLTQPGNSIRDYIEGKRVKHFRPISLLVVLATLYGLLYHFFSIDIIAYSREQSSENGIKFEMINEWISTHFAWFTLASVPLFTFGTYIAFRNKGYTVMEYLILNAFKGSQRLFVHIAAFPLVVCFSGTPYLGKVTGLLFIIDLFLIFWTNIQFFNNLTRMKAFLLSLLSYIIFLFSVTIIIALVALILEFK